MYAILIIYLILFLAVNDFVFSEDASLSSSLKRAILSIPGFNFVSRALQASGKVRQRVVAVHYLDRSIEVDVTIKSWIDFILEIENDADLKLSLKVHKVYHKNVNGEFTIVKEIEQLKDEHHYYITTMENELPGKFTFFYII